ncbi:hypothetical protein KC333_g7276 [Hortaea werneckii]|nr:hypothetical protein KC333_g7276 [Hortaea werneckii]KAI7308918.1 hypothetical protein KC326_g7258 [Hortaea werneckii]
MSLQTHWEIIDVLTELYALLDTLAAVPPNLLRLPPADTGTHPADVFNAETASAAGFSSEAVKVLSALPYLKESVVIAPSTVTLNYCAPYMDVSIFENSREMMYDGNFAPPSVIQLTGSEGGYGCIYVYDTESQKVFPWTPMYDGASAADDDGDDSDGCDYFHVKPKSPREALQPLINEFRGLHYINKPLNENTNTSHQLFEETLNVGVTKTFTEDEIRRWVGKEYYRHWQISRELKDMYLDCGWQVDSVEQPDFRREEFLERRRRHLAKAKSLAAE